MTEHKPAEDLTGSREVVESLYRAFLAGDLDGMLALFSDDIELRFLGQIDTKGLDSATRFFRYSSALLRDVDFRIERKIVDGQWAAVLWTESATTAAGDPWVNHGVDVLRIDDGKITALHENNDCRLVHRHFPPYPQT